MTDQRGMTLIELLVAMSLSTIVIFAASAMIISALNVTNQVTGRTAALAQGRTAMETLLGQLNSGCLINSLSPVQASTSPTTTLSPVVSSDANHLVFVSGVNDSATATPTLHVVTISGGALMDSAYAYTAAPSTIATPKAWTFSNSPSQVLNLAQHVASGTGPYFSYSAYPTTAPYSLQNPVALTPPLTSTTAPTVAEVDLDFRFSPTGTSYNANTTSSELKDSAVFSLTADNSGTPNLPCQ